MGSPPEIPPPLEGPACQDLAFCRMAALTSSALQKRSLCLGSPPEIPPLLEGPACQDRAFCRMAALTSRAFQKRSLCMGPEIPPLLEGPACQDCAFCRMAALTSRALQKRSLCMGSPPRNRASAGGSCLSGLRLLPNGGSDKQSPPEEVSLHGQPPPKFRLRWRVLLVRTAQDLAHLSKIP